MTKHREIIAFPVRSNRQGIETTRKAVAKALKLLNSAIPSATKGMLADEFGNQFSEDELEAIIEYAELHKNELSR